MPETIIKIRWDDRDDRDNAIFWMAERLSDGKELPGEYGDDGWRYTVEDKE